MTKTGVFLYSINVSMRDVYVAKIDFDQNRVLEGPKRASRKVPGGFAPAWSSDGEYLAFASKREEEPHRVLCILSNRTGEVRELFPQLISFRNPTLFHWSPDSQSVIHTGFDKPYGKGFFKTDLKTGNLSVLFRDADPGQIRGSCLSHDGKTMFYNKMNTKAKMSQLLAINLETREVEELYEGEFMNGLALSPDERRLVFSENVAGLGKEIKLTILPVEGKEPRTIYTFKKGKYMSTIAWTPDGRYLLFSQIEKGKSSLWKISPEGSQPQELGITQNGIRHLRIHPDSQHIAFSSGTPGKEVWAMENFIPKSDKKK
jgi:Tol biopolymer transport system component